MTNSIDRDLSNSAQRSRVQIVDVCSAARGAVRIDHRLALRPSTKCMARFAGPMAWIAGLLLVALALTSAEASPSPSAGDLSVHDVAQRVDRHYNQLHSLKSGFSESYEGMGMSRTESGTLFLLKPGRMKWESSVPAGKLFLLDGKFAWFYSRGDPQVQRIPAKQLDDLRSPLRFLLGHTELEKELENLHMTAAPNGQFTLTGQPKGQEKRVRRLTLTVSPDGAIKAIEIEEADGALTRFTFSSEQPNTPIPPDAFHFTPPLGIPVVDALPPV